MTQKFSLGGWKIHSAYYQANPVLTIQVGIYMSDIHYMHLCNVHMHLISRNPKYVYQSVLFKQKSILVLFHFHFIQITFTSSNTLLLLILNMYVSLSTILEKVIKFYLRMPSNDSTNFGLSLYHKQNANLIRSQTKSYDSQKFQ